MWKPHSVTITIFFNFFKLYGNDKYREIYSE